jgi:hypothetical protein
MKSDDGHGRFSHIIASYTTEVQRLASEARRAIFKALPHVVETTDPSSKVVGYGYGPGYKGMICTIILSKTAVKIGIVRGSELPDPRGLMHGSGKVHKHIEIMNVDEARSQGIRSLLNSALDAWKKRNPRS